MAQDPKPVVYAGPAFGPQQMLTAPGHEFIPTLFSPTSWAVQVTACPTGAPGKRLVPKAGRTRYGGTSQRAGLAPEWEMA